MADTEDWRRQRAEELRLHDPGPWRVRPASDRQPVADAVEPMRPPVAPANGVPVRDDIPRDDSGIRLGAEPVARRYRQGPPFAQSTVATAVADTPPIASRTTAPRASGGSMVARHPLLFGAAIGGALTAAGALGWMLHTEIGPASGPALAAVRPTEAVPIAAPVLQPSVAPITPVLTDTSAAETQHRVSTATTTAPEDRPPPRALEPIPAVEAPVPRHADAEAVRHVSGPVSAARAKAAKSAPAAKLADKGKPAAKVKPAAKAKPEVKAKPEAKAKPGAKAKAAAASIASNDKASRFAHPAKAVALPGRSFSPSFNCRRAIAVVNRAICASPELSALDRQVSQRFYRATAKGDLEHHKAIDREQVDFLNQRASCNSDDCVARVYRQRLAALRQGGPDN